MRLLLGSGGLGTPERRQAWLTEFDDILGDVRRVAFLPYALRDHDGYVRDMDKAGLAPDRKLVGLHRAKDPVAALRKAEAIYVGGGNSFRLLADLYRLRLLPVIRERVRAGVPYIGISAGTNMACPTMKTTNDMPITKPPSLDALGLVPFQVNPHYFSGPIYYKTAAGYVPYAGETRDDRIEEFHEMNDTVVVGLWEGSAIRVDHKKAVVRGTAGCRIFRKGKPPEDRPAGADVSDLL